MLDSLCVSHVVFVSQLSESTSLFFFLMIRRPPRSTLDRSSAASDVYKRQGHAREPADRRGAAVGRPPQWQGLGSRFQGPGSRAVSYTHLRAHETVLDLVCRLLLEKKKHVNVTYTIFVISLSRETQSLYHAAASGLSPGFFCHDGA